MITVGIDASRSTSGGAAAHLCGILSSLDPAKHNIKSIHVWAPSATLEMLPVKYWLIKHEPDYFANNIVCKLWWQFRNLPKIAHTLGCNILINTDAGTVCPFSPSVTIHQDLLAFEKGEIWRQTTLFKILRLIALHFTQIHSIKNANGAIFLTEYAKSILVKKTGPLKNSAVIPHGVNDIFRRAPETRLPIKQTPPYKLIYISNVAPYKHQIKVVNAVSSLNKNNILVNLELVGATGPKNLENQLDILINKVDPNRSFINRRFHVPNQELPGLLDKADIFVFASSCETMPVTLIEAMASSLPIACSSRGPMPEVLANAGIFFDPEDSDSIRDALVELINSPSLREEKAADAYNRAKELTWNRCADEVFAFTGETLSLYNSLKGK